MNINTYLKLTSENIEESYPELTVKVRRVVVSDTGKYLRKNFPLGNIKQAHSHFINVKLHKGKELNLMFHAMTKDIHNVVMFVQNEHSDKIYRVCQQHQIVDIIEQRLNIKPTYKYEIVEQKPTEYFDVEAEAMKVDGDKNYCAPLAISIVTDKPYAEVLDNCMSKYNRKLRQGMYNAHIIQCVEDYTGKFSMKRIYDHLSTDGELRTNDLDYMLRDDCSYLVFTRSHVAAYKNGRIHDWSHCHNYVVLSVYKLIEEENDDV